MSRRECEACGRVIDPNFDAHDVLDDETGRELWFCAECCPTCLDEKGADDE